MPTKTSRKRTDNVTVIKGIGPATETWLKQTLDVRTLKDLAALDAERIEQGLNGQNGPVSSSQVNEWATQAQELIGATGPAKRGGGSDDSIRDRQPEPRQNKWKPLATFVVEFQSRTGANGVEEKQTKCQQDETAQEEKWPGIEGEGLLRWMLDQIGESKPVKPEQAATPEQAPLLSPSAASQKPAVETQLSEPRPAVAPPAEKSASVQRTRAAPVTVEITQIRAYQPPAAKTPQVVATSAEGCAGFLRSGEPVSFELSFKLAGDGASEIAKKHTPFHVDIYAYNRSTAARKHLSDSERESTQKGKLTYTKILPKAMLEAGTYRLDCAAVLEGATSDQGYLRVPALQVN